MALNFKKAKDFYNNLKLKSQQSPLAQNVRSFLNTPVKSTPLTRGIVKTGQTLAPIVNQYGKGFSESSTYGLYQSPIQGPKSLSQSIGYGVGFGAGILNPLNPVNKLNLFGKIGSLGSKPAQAIISKVAPKATGFVAKRLLPAAAS